MQTQSKPHNDLPTHPNTNSYDNPLPEPPYTLGTGQDGKINGRRQGKTEEAGDDEGVPLHHHNNWDDSNHPSRKPQNTSSKPIPSRSGRPGSQGHPGIGVGPAHKPRRQQENVVLRRGFVPRTAPERVAQRKSSMAQLQQWVNQRRGMASQEDLSR